MAWWITTSILHHHLSYHDITILGVLSTGLGQPLRTAGPVDSVLGDISDADQPDLEAYRSVTLQSAQQVAASYKFLPD